MDYEALELELVERLNNYFAATVFNGSDMLSTVFTARQMPDSDDDFSEPGDKAIVNVHYANSDYDKPRITNAVSQTETITVAFYIQARKLRGNKGANTLLKHVKACTIGFKPTNCRNAMWVSSFGQWTFQGAGVQPFIELSFDTISSQIVTNEPAVGGTINGTPSDPAITVNNNP